MAKKSLIKQGVISSDKRTQRDNIFTKTKAPRLKYGNKKASYGGYTYDSTKEMEYAMDLDWRKKAKEVKEWSRQYRFDIVVNGRHICFYIIDFRVVLRDGSIEYVEVKGFETDKWILKWKLAEATFEDMTKGERARLVLVK